MLHGFNYTAGISGTPQQRLEIMASAIDSRLSGSLRGACQHSHFRRYDARPQVRYPGGSTHYGRNDNEKVHPSRHLDR